MSDPIPTDDAVIERDEIDDLRPASTRAIEVQDRPGGLAGLLERFEAARLGIEYLYPFPLGRKEGAIVLVFRVDDPAAAASDTSTRRSAPMARP